jgi:hypothetical protein
MNKCKVLVQKKMNKCKVLVQKKMNKCKAARALVVQVLNADTLA